ncbi:MAG TPA: aminoglycoside phosphotransferase family protein [Actinomycetota bacterium]|nr:aminoglycoside phosphotransferase family protein [Actinomycetota bacterium]
MTAGKMHADEVHTDARLVLRLLLGQFPEWADLPIERVPSNGTDHAMYRLGDELAVRLPRIADALGQAGDEFRWLPRLAPLLPLEIPVPVAQGTPAEGYPWEWSIYRWIDGGDASMENIADPRRAAADLGRFVAALQRIDTGDGPVPYGSPRGGPLAERDAETREGIGALDGWPGLEGDASALVAAWEAALCAQPWDGPPVWLHGDLHGENLLARDRVLAAVIDFGCMGVGDPACDLMPAWLYLSAGTREAFRAELSVDEPTWARGRGWALSLAVIALPYYVRTNPGLADVARHGIHEILSDRGR